MVCFRPHPDNPRIFEFRGRPTVLVTSAEHYGAVLNADFNTERYLATLAADGLNNTRIFVGAYCEPVGAFKIADNTLAPAPGRFLSPWARSGTPGYANGGNRFDLERWDEAYFARLRDVVEAAGRHDIVIEVNLFCPFYRDEMWDLSPMKASNNVNGVGDVPRERAYTAEGDGGLLAVQEAMTRKVVDELRGYDNLFYEVMNEPYQRDVAVEWQARIVEVIREVEGDTDAHLISLNVANRKADVREVLGGEPPAGVGLINFHYAWPPVTVADNWDLGLALGDNETGFAGQADYTYRREGWAFLHAGGALFNHLDYSFTVGHEDGSFAYPETQPGGGSAALRRSLGALRRFVEGFDLVRLQPVAPARWEGVPDGTAVFGLEVPGRELAAYVCRTSSGDDGGAGAGVALRLSWPAGSWRLEWVSPLDGEVLQARVVEHGGGALTLTTPGFAEDVALRLVAASR